MKRFYCPKCRRIVRARSLPRDAHKDASGDMVGTCKHHPRNEDRKALKRIGATGRW